MSIKPNISEGVAPVWKVVTDGAGWTPSTRELGTGFYVGTGGDVAFQSEEGVFITQTFPSNFLIPATIKAIGTAAQGTTATNILVSTTG